jgi:two-component SAPR family response regulator
MTKDMWTDILNNVTEKDRKPLIHKILNKVKHAYDTLYQDKETTIDINFYKSIFKGNPFPYKELINVTRTGEGVTPIIYGVEELFKLYEDELKFIKDNKSNDAVKPPLKQKKIEVTHKRKNPEFPSIFDSST